MTFFLFSKCLGFFTHSHNASAVSLIFFCDSEYDQSLVPSPDRAFCLVSTNNVPIFAHDKKGPPQTRLKHDCLFICLLRHCRKCSTVGKGLFFFFKLRSLLRERICFNGYWLPAGQRVDFKMHSDAFVARLLTSTCRYVSQCPTTDLVKIFSPCRH